MSVRNWWDEFPYKRGERRPVPANAAGQAGQGTMTLFNDTYSAILLELEALRAQVVAMQAVVDAARKTVRDWDPARMRLVNHRSIDEIKVALDALDKAQAAQPESEHAG